MSEYPLSLFSTWVGSAPTESNGRPRTLLDLLGGVLGSELSALACELLEVRLLTLRFLSFKSLLAFFFTGCTSGLTSCCKFDNPRVFKNSSFLLIFSNRCSSYAFKSFGSFFGDMCAVRAPQAEGGKIKQWPWCFLFSLLFLIVQRDLWER